MTTRRFLVLVAVLLALVSELSRFSSGHEFPSDSKSRQKKPSIVPEVEKHHIYVLILDGRAGEPVSNQWVALRGLGENNKPTTPLVSAITNSHGAADLVFDDPLPERFGLILTYNTFDSCSNVEFRADAIFRTGVVSPNHCASAEVFSAQVPTPGHLVIFGHKLTFWERFRRAG